MSKIPAAKLIALFRRMYDEHWPYVLGAAREGCVDCSGAFVWAYRQFGQSIAHGSNAIARNYVRGLLPVSQAVPGMAAFKRKEPGQPGYDLPEKYKGGKDLSDYYHIGLVDEGGYVLNAQGTKAGFTRTPISKWSCVGYLKAVDYNQGGSTMQMIVTAANGEPVRVRKQPSTSAETVARLHVGQTVEAGEDTNGWRPISWDGGNGYMMSKFLTETGSGASSGGQGDNPPAFVRTLSTDEFTALCDLRDQMENGVALLKRIVGVG